LYKTQDYTSVVSSASKDAAMEINLYFTPQPNGLLAAENVLPQMQRWQSEGQRTVLVTLISIDGVAPRHAGAQMAVAEHGRSCGYLSGGCLERAVVLEAQAVIASGRNKLVRYGEGSPFFDIKLPCGSGLDLYFDQSISPSIVTDLIGLRDRRQTAQLRTELATGASTVQLPESELPIAPSARDGDIFTRTYAPEVRLLLLGSGPALIGTAVLAAALGVEMSLAPSDEATRAALAAAGHRVDHLDKTDARALEHLDFATAAVLFFHAHEQEPELLRHLLKSKCFYIGALGNRAVHRQRLDALAAMGFDGAALSRIRAPVGTIANAKSKSTLALGVLT
jgi:xanthine dehydrogenase accessory factor